MTKRQHMTQIEVPDYDLGLRGKLLKSDKTLGPMAFCLISYGMSLLDDVTDTEFSNIGNGFPDGRVVPDESTRVEIPWRQGTDAVISDFVNEDGTPFGASARGAVSTLAARYAEQKLIPVLGFEYEVWIFKEDPDSEFHGVRGLSPWGRTQNAYSLTRSMEVDDLATDFIDRMEQVGIEVESFHSELGPGFFEYALAPVPALLAADNASRSRQYLRDLCAERGLRASFMAKPFGAFSGAGGHVHSSLVSDGVNIMSDDGEELSPRGASYVAGLLATMPDYTLLFSPYVNSFKRADPELYVGDSSYWNIDDRNATCRVILENKRSARVEHRRPGADANPYVVAAGILAGGLVGLDNGLRLPEPGKAGSVPIPDRLGDAIRALENSTTAPTVLDRAFVKAYCDTRRDEYARYKTWMKSHITPWELSRHLDHQ